jgi:hypothetical protein
VAKLIIKKCQTETILDNNKTLEYDHEQLSTFLSECERTMSNKLLDNLKSRVFDGIIFEFRFRVVY